MRCCWASLSQAGTPNTKKTTSLTFTGCGPLPRPRPTFVSRARQSARDEQDECTHAEQRSSMDARRVSKSSLYVFCALSLYL